MPEAVNKTFLGSTLDAVDDPSAEVMVDVDRVTMVFNMASEQLNSLKEYAIALARHELRFKEFRALDDVSFKVRRGDVFGILGTNGSGKSTVLKIIAGVLDPSMGSCTVKGNIAPLIELGAGFDMDLTARENIYLNGALLGYTKEFIDSHFDEIVEFAEIEKFLDMPLKNYSSGMVARIAFAVATATIPDVLIVDEVLSVGDFMFQQKCERRISSMIKDHQVTVLIVSHNTDQVERLCNKAIWIEKGHVRMIGAAHDVCETYRIVGGREGSSEAETLVLDTMFNKDVIPSGEQVEVIAGESRYTTAIKLANKCIDNGASSDCVIITSGESKPDNLLANIVASTHNAPVFTIGREMVPAVTLRELKELKPSKFIVIKSEDSIFPNVWESFMANFPNAQFDIVDATEKDLLSLNVFDYANRQKTDWSSTAVLSYKECFEDLITLAPYMYKTRTPLFYCLTPKTIREEVLETIITNFKKVIVVGNTDEIQESCLDLLRNKGLEAIRLVGEDTYQANHMINKLMEEKMASLGIKMNPSVLISSSWQPEHSFTLGAFAGRFGMSIVLEDPGSLDGVSRAIHYIQNKASILDKIIFIGDDAVYSYRDRQLLERALLLAQNKKS